MTEATDARGEFVKAGYLIKSPPLNRALVSQWHRRWFLLMDSKLVYPLAHRYVRLDYYQSEAEAKRLADPKGSIDLGTCLAVVAHNEHVKNFRFVFDVSTSDRVYHLAADSEEERVEWVSVLKDLLFPSSTNGHRSKDSSRMDSPEVTRRLRESVRLQRPMSCTGLVTDSKTSRVQKRPLPPVPDSDASSVPSSPVERRNRPLPATPAGVHLHPAASPPLSSRKKPPPLKPTPYRKNTSQPLPPEISPRHGTSPSVARSASLSPPPPPLLAEDYQEFVFTSQPDTEDNYSLATGVPHGDTTSRGLHERGLATTTNTEHDYSVLESTVVHGYNMKDEDYSHLGLVVNDSPPPPVRQSSLAQHHHHLSETSASTTTATTPRVGSSSKPTPVPRKKRSAIPDYVNCPSEDNDDYSHLQR